LRYGELQELDDGKIIQKLLDGELLQVLEGYYRN
jgi:hypothetical protein